MKYYQNYTLYRKEFKLFENNFFEFLKIETSSQINVFTYCYNEITTSRMQKISYTLSRLHVFKKITILFDIKFDDTLKKSRIDLALKNSFLKNIQLFLNTI